MCTTIDQQDERVWQSCCIDQAACCRQGTQPVVSPYHDTFPRPRLVPTSFWKTWSKVRSRQYHSNTHSSLHFMNACINTGLQ